MYRIEIIQKDRKEIVKLIRRSDAGRHFSFMVLGMFFTGLGIFGLIKVWLKLDLWRKSDGAILPILFGLSLALACLGVRFLLTKDAPKPRELLFDEDAQMLLLASNGQNEPVFKIPYSSMHSFILGKSLVQSSVGNVRHKRVRYRALLVFKNFACWTLLEHQGWPKQKAPITKALEFLDALKSRIDLIKRSPRLDVLDVNDCPIRLLVDETSESWSISWRSSMEWRSLWTLGVPVGLLLGLFAAYKEMQLNPVLLGIVILSVGLVAIYLGYRIGRSVYSERILDFSEGRFRAYSKGSPFPDPVNLPLDWIGSFRFEPTEIGRWPVMIVVPKERQDSDGEHIGELQDEQIALQTEYRSSMSRPLREKWVKTFDTAGLSFQELVFLEAWLNQRLNKSRS
jgi:hypothetical protein